MYWRRMLRQPLMPSGTTTITVASPLRSARLQAQNTDSQLQLLRDALAIRPEAITPRVAAFRAARQTADHTLALAALMPLINQTGLGQQLFKQDFRF